MPTINQLVRKVEKYTNKSNTPALGYNYNTLKGRVTPNQSPQKRRRLYIC